MPKPEPTPDPWAWAAGVRKPRSPENRAEPPDPEELSKALAQLEPAAWAVVMGSWQWRMLRRWVTAKPHHFVAFAGDPDCFDRVPIVIKGKRTGVVICRTHEELQDVLLGRD